MHAVTSFEGNRRPSQGHKRKKILPTWIDVVLVGLVLRLLLLFLLQLLESDVAGLVAGLAAGGEAGFGLESERKA